MPYATILTNRPHRIEKLFEELAKLAPKRAIFALKEATKLYEKCFRGSALEVYETSKTANLKGEAGRYFLCQKQAGEMIVKEDILALELPPKNKRLNCSQN